MDKINISDLNIAILRKHLSNYKQIGIGDDFTIMDVLSTEKRPSPEYTCRINGVVIIYCVSGSIRLTANLKELTIKEQDLTIFDPGTHVRITSLGTVEATENRFIIISMSQKFAGELRVDFKRVLSDGMGMSETPIIDLNQETDQLFKDYLRMIHRIIKGENAFKETALTSLISSMVCFLAGLWLDKIQDIRKQQKSDTNRSRVTFDNFIRLVSEHYTKHRNVGFYADHLCLTPKYLSKVVKNFSGKSAPDWIDAYVILEAKNLLRYSDLAIKEIVYRLNFPNQSVFYKFFKTRTGITPSQYRGENTL